MQENRTNRIIISIIYLLHFSLLTERNFTKQNWPLNNKYARDILNTATTTTTTTTKKKNKKKTKIHTEL